MFLETAFNLDATGLSIGTSSNNTLTAILTIDKTNAYSVNSSTFTVAVPANTNPSSVPYTATLVKTNSNICTLTITLSQPIANIHLGETRVLTITGSSGGTFTLSVQINYANLYLASDWTNVNADGVISNIELKGPLTSTSINNKLKTLLQTSLTAYNQIKDYIKYYSYKEKYLSDIIDFAISAGASLESSNTTNTITINSDGNISSILTVYSTPNRRNQRLLINYNYATYTLERLRKRTISNNTTYSTLDSSNMSLLNSMVISAVDSSNSTIYTLGTITLTRTDNTIYSIPYLADYTGTDDTLSANILSDYKYYRTSVITGWTVS